MKRKSVYILSICLLAATAANAGSPVHTDTRIIEAVVERSSASSLFIDFAFDNPAMKRYRFGSSLSDIRLNWDYLNESEPYRMQEGNGHNLLSFTVDSYKFLPDGNIVWGNVAYRNGQKKNIVWNSTSDYATLYPYITANATGGGLKSEEYAFGGGYGFILGSVSFGLEAAYRAMHEYWDKDPRSRNIISDIDISAGASVSLGDGYRAGIAVDYRNYKQRNSMAYYRKGDKLSEYIMTGLGTYSYIFMTYSHMRYIGNSVGVSVSLLPNDGRGLTMNVGYNNFSFDRIIGLSTGDSQYPQNKLTDNTVTATAAYTFGSRTRWGVKGEFAYSDRRGNEIMYGNPSSLVKIGEFTKYVQKLPSASVSLIAEGKAGGSVWSAEPFALWQSSIEEYIYPSHKMDIGTLSSGMRLRFAHRWKYALLQVSAGGEYLNVLDSELVMPVANMDAGIVEMMRTTFSRLSDDRLTVNAAVRVDCAIGNGNTLGLEAGWLHTRFNAGSDGDRMAVSLIFSF